ncbi:MAG TPA: lytic transglycosylase domain-containing protein [Methylophilaceae bacterium]|nr:lytic transglycosylase domain-containing protein [Methylophilaceae bacterium]
MHIKTPKLISPKSLIPFFVSSLFILPAQAIEDSNAYLLKQDAKQVFKITDTDKYRLDQKYRPADAKPAKETEKKQPDALLVHVPAKGVHPQLASRPFAKEIAKAANAASLDPALVHAVIYVESRYRASAISHKGAIGLMQVIPDTGARYGIYNLEDSPQSNLRAGTLYLRDLLRMFNNRLDLALAAYNAGEGTVIKYAYRIPPYRETQLYVRSVLAKYNEWRSYTMASDSTAEMIQSPPLAAAEPERLEYLTGTRLIKSKPRFAPTY